MIIIIDAYNFLWATQSYKKTITDKERIQFIKRLIEYGRRKKHKIVIVFDGGPYERPFIEKFKTICIVYSGVNEIADDYIKQYLVAHHAKDLLLVSSDSELNHHAARLRIPSIDSSSFNQLVHEELRVKKDSSYKNDNTVVKFIRDNNVDIDALMMDASKVIPTKSEDIVAVDKSRDAKKTTVSKQERALLKKLNKL